MIGLKLDDKQLKELEQDLKALNKKAIPHASRFTLNQTARFAQKKAQGIVRNKMIQRNKWTAGSILFETTKDLRIAQQETAMGSTEKYLADQEHGKTERPSGKHGVAIPTGYSAGQEGQRPRTRLVRKAHRLVNIKFKRASGASFFRKIQGAVKSGRRYLSLDMGHGTKGTGIYKVIGGSKRTARGWPKGAKLKMIHDLSRQSVRIPPRPWNAPAAVAAVRMMPRFYEKALMFQLQRLKTYKR